MRRYATAIALALGLAVVIYPIAKTSQITVISAVGGLGLGFLVVALASKRARALAAPAVILIALHYALTLHVAHAGLDVYSVLVGAGLFVVFEAADLSASLLDVAPLSLRSFAHRAAVMLASVLAGALLTMVAIPARALFSPNVIVVVLGATGVLGVVGIVLTLALRRETRSSATPDADRW
jgi:hypothetical protein